MRYQKENPLAYYNFLRTKYESMSGQVEVKSHPYIMVIDPSSICQLRCSGCPTGIENESLRLRQPVFFRERTKMTEILFDTLLDEVGDHLFHLDLYNWGEPLLHSQLPAFIRKAKEYQITVTIHSNLSLRLSDERLEDLLKSGVDEIAVSIDGFSQETYETYRRGGNFELVKTNIERLAALRDHLDLQTEIIWNLLVFRWNEHEIEDIRRFCDQIGVTFNRREAYVMDTEWLPSYRQHEEKAITGKIQHNKSQSELKRHWCNWHYAISNVNANGTVSPCCGLWEQRHDFGSIVPGETDFQDIWNHRFFRQSRAIFANKSHSRESDVVTPCLHCPFGADEQGKYSFADALIVDQFYRVFDGKDPLLGQAFRLLSRPKEYLEFYHQNADKFASEERKYLATPRPECSFGTPEKIGWHSFLWRLRRGVKRILKSNITTILNRRPNLYSRLYIARYQWKRRSRH